MAIPPSQQLQANANRQLAQQQKVLVQQQLALYHQNNSTAAMNNLQTQTNLMAAKMKAVCLAFQNTVQGNNSTAVNTSFVSSTAGNSLQSYITPPDDPVLTQDSYIEEYLVRHGKKLDDGGYLFIKDGEPIIIYQHAHGVEKLRPVRRAHKGVIDLIDAQAEVLPDTCLRLPDGTIVHITKDGEIVKETVLNARAQTIDVRSDKLSMYESLAFCNFGQIHLDEGADSHTTLILPNGVKINLFPDDHIEIDESDGRQLYKTAPVRNFNEYLNASDMLERFILYCAEQKVTQKEFTELPISLFIYWLIVQATEADGEPTDTVLPLLTTSVKQRKAHSHRCKGCGQFLSKHYQDHAISFCSPEHMTLYMAKI